MTPAHVKAMLPIFTAYAEGKQIQYKGYGSELWEDALGLGFDDQPDCYRVKPEPPKPREFWQVWEKDGGTLELTFPSRESALNWIDHKTIPSRFVIVHVREVLP